jgi:hypothetical protein
MDNKKRNQFCYPYIGHVILSPIGHESKKKLHETQKI